MYRTLQRHIRLGLAFVQRPYLVFGEVARVPIPVIATKVRDARFRQVAPTGIAVQV
jgi:hypothetical protein